MTIQEDTKPRWIGISRKAIADASPEIVREFADISPAHAGGAIEMTSISSWRPEHVTMVSSSIKDSIASLADLPLRGPRWADFRISATSALIGFNFELAKMVCIESAAIVCVLPDEIVGINSLRDFLSARSTPADILQRTNGFRDPEERDLFSLANTVAYLYETRSNPYMNEANILIVCGFLDALAKEVGHDHVADVLCSAVDPALSLYSKLIENSARIARGEKLS